MKSVWEAGFGSKELYVAHCDCVKAERNLVRLGSPRKGYWWNKLLAASKRFNAAQRKIKR